MWAAYSWKYLKTMQNYVSMENHFLIRPDMEIYEYRISSRDRTWLLSIKMGLRIRTNKGSRSLKDKNRSWSLYFLPHPKWPHCGWSVCRPEHKFYLIVNRSESSVQMDRSHARILRLALTSLPSQ